MAYNLDMTRIPEHVAIIMEETADGLQNVERYVATGIRLVWMQ